MSIETFLAVLAIIAANLGTVLALFMHGDRKLDEHKKEMNDIMRSIQEEVKSIHMEMKDFHGRLCAIEERGKK